MNPLSVFLSQFKRLGLSLDEEQRERVAALQAPSSMAETLRAQRFVVVDCETSGLNIERDIVLSIGAVVIEDCAVDFSQQFECTLQRKVKVTESVLIHGIAPSELASGTPPIEALLSFMEFAGDCVFLAFHAPFDQRMLTRALQDELGYKLEHRFIDIADLAPLLYPEAFVNRGGLDHWIKHFRIDIPQRHHAAADALATAEIALILFNRAQQVGLGNPHELFERLWHWQRAKKASRHTF